MNSAGDLPEAHALAPVPRVARILAAIENAAMVVVAAALTAIMLITVTDVIRRYVFNAPLPWAYDITAQYLLVAAFFLALSYTLRVDGHMNVDILLLKLSSKRAVAALTALGDALALVFFVALFFASAATAWTAWVDQDVLPGVIALPVWISRALVPLGTAILVLRLCYRLAVYCLRLKR